MQRSQDNSYYLMQERRDSALLGSILEKKDFSVKISGCNINLKIY